MSEFGPEFTVTEYGCQSDDGTSVIRSDMGLMMLVRAMRGRPIFKRSVTGSNYLMTGPLLGGAELKMKSGMPTHVTHKTEWELV